jgi:hypothetical protein
MKNAQFPTKEEPSALDSAHSTQTKAASSPVFSAGFTPDLFDPVFAPPPAVGTFPPSKSSVRAEVLCRLLAGERLTGMEAVFAASTTRLAPAIKVLKNQYGWPIASEDLAVGTADGRVSWVAVYYLPQHVIDAAKAVGIEQYCEQVMLARRLQRAAREDARRRAAAANAKRKNGSGGPWAAPAAG